LHIKKILLVDDSPVARMLLKKCIGDNFEIFEAGSGEEGIKLLGSLSIDLIFLDLTMPGMNGLEVLVEMKKMKKDAKIIILSADRQTSTIRQAIESGAVTVLKKPPRQEKILNIISLIKQDISPEVEGLNG